jgi:hypothetical protein
VRRPPGSSSGAIQRPSGRKAASHRRGRQGRHAAVPHRSGARPGIGEQCRRLRRSWRSGHRLLLGRAGLQLAHRLLRRRIRSCRWAPAAVVGGSPRNGAPGMACLPNRLRRPPVPKAPRPMMIAPVVLTSSSTTGRLTCVGLKYQSYRPPSAPPGPQISPSSDTAMSSSTRAMVALLQSARSLHSRRRPKGTKFIAALGIEPITARRRPHRLNPGRESRASAGFPSVIRPSWGRVSPWQCGAARRLI